MTIHAIQTLNESWQATTRSPSVTPLTFSANLDVRSDRVGHIGLVPQVVYPSSTIGMPGSVAGTNVAFIASRFHEEPCAPKTSKISDFVRKMEANGFSEQIKSARSRFSHRVKPNASGGLSLKGLRLKHGLSQMELAEKLETSQPHVARLECGRADPTRNTMRKLAAVFGIDMNAIDQAFEKEHSK